MSVTIEGHVSEYFPCSAQDFKVNGVNADQEWFVSKTQGSCPEDCEGYDCHDIKFHHRELHAVREKLPASLDNTLSDRDIVEVQDWLIDCLLDGDCGMCV